MLDKSVIDISHHQAKADFEELLQNGVLAVIHKATEGSTYIDPEYIARKHAAQEAGLLWSAYHFLRPGNMDAQARHFAKNAGLDLDFYVADHEDAGVSLDDLKRFLYVLTTETGKPFHVIYSGHVIKEQLGDRYDPELAPHRLWIAHYTTKPEPDWPKATWPRWFLWQYTETGTVPGVTAPTDLDRFDGTEEELFSAWTGSEEFPLPDPEPQPEPQPPARVIVSITVSGPVDLRIKQETKKED